MNKTIFSLLIILAWVSFSICSNAWALKIKRISAKVLDLGKVNKVYISAGLASVIIFPKPIIEVKLGNPDLIKTTISKTLPNELTLIINKDLRSPSNIIVRAGSRNFIFDVFPSQTMHQDLVQVMASYGGPEYDETELKLIDSSDKEKARPTGILIDSSEKEIMKGQSK